MSTGVEDFQFITQEKGRADWKVETTLDKDEVKTIIADVCTRIKDVVLTPGEFGDYYEFKIANETLVFGCKPNNHLLSYDKKTGFDRCGHDIHIAVSYPIVDEDVHPKIKRVAAKVVETLREVIDGFGARDKILGSL